MSEGQEIAAGTARSAFGGASQHNRLMRLDFPLKDGPFAILLRNKLVAHEEVSRSFRFNVEVLSDDAQIPLKEVNQAWRQRWLTAGQAFRDPKRDWLLTLESADLKWHLLEAETPKDE